MHSTRTLLAVCAAAAVACAEDAADDVAKQRAADLAPPVRLEAAGEPLEVGGFAAPYVGDFDGDGKHDIMVGQFDLGRMRIYRNVGSNARPEFKSFEWFVAGGHTAAVPQCCQIVFTPQLVDFDKDGLTDILTGSGVAGEVFLFRRKADRTFAAAEVLENAEGQTQMHRGTREDSDRPRTYNVTATAYDWDADGDNDLLMGTYPLCLVINNGTAREPSFDGGRRIECEGGVINSGMGAPHMADWDGDGLDDLVTADRRDVVWYRNIGERGKPRFESARLLVPRGKGSPSHEPSKDRPGFPHAFCVADFNADGRLDLLLGDRFTRRVEGEREGGEQAAANRERESAARERYRSLCEEPEKETRHQRIERYRKRLRAWSEYIALKEATARIWGTRGRRGGHVWFYERLATGDAQQERADSGSR